MPEPYIVAMGRGSLAEAPAIPYMNDFILGLAANSDIPVVVVPEAWVTSSAG